MSSDIDTSIEVAGLKFKSPILISSSECVSDLSLVKNLVKRNIGGLVTKTFTTTPENRIRVRPYQFPLRVFGKAYGEGPCLFSLSAPHVEEMPKVFDFISQSAEICHSASLNLIASYFEDPTEVDLWIESAVAFERAGADMLELNFSSPSAAKLFANSYESSSMIIREIKDKVSIPVGLKIGPSLEPLEDLVMSWAKLKIDFITAHNAPNGIIIDVEKQVPFGAPTIGGYVLGRAFLPYSLARVVRIRKVADIPIIGVGGIYCWNDALQYILCGCPLVGIGSGMYFHGFDLVDDIHQGITDWMRRKGYYYLEAFRGKVLPLIKDPKVLREKEPYPFAVPPDCPYVPVIDDEKCKTCGICAQSCIYGALQINKRGSRVQVVKEKCWSCGFCVGICPAKAIELRDRNEQGRLIWKNEGMAEPFRDC